MNERKTSRLNLLLAESYGGRFLSFETSMEASFTCLLLACSVSDRDAHLNPVLPSNKFYISAA